jgi:hypothetical protein
MSVEAWPDREFPSGQEVGVIALDGSAMVGVFGRLWMVSRNEVRLSTVSGFMTHNGQDLVNRHLASFGIKHELVQQEV